jgi:ABC-type phosphate transport system substrate-binding protein
LKNKLTLPPRSARLVVFLAVLSALPIRAEVVVISSTRNTIEHVSQDDVSYIFMGRYRKLPDGSTARPLDLEADSPVRKAFYRQLVDKSPEEINAYWARLVFAGRTTPPAETKGQEELLEKVANDPKAIGYIDRAYLNHSTLARNVKIILVLPNQAEPR